MTRRWLGRIARGFGYLTLDPSSRLRRLREDLEHEDQTRRGPLPPLPDSAYPPWAVPLDCSGIPGRADNHMHGQEQQRED